MEVILTVCSAHSGINVRQFPVADSTHRPRRKKSRVNAPNCPQLSRFEILGFTKMENAPPTKFVSAKTSRGMSRSATLVVPCSAAKLDSAGTPDTTLESDKRGKEKLIPNSWLV